MKRLTLLLIVVAGAAVLVPLPLPSSSSSVVGPLFSMLYWSSSASVDAPAYRTAAVERGDVVATVQAAGTLNAVVLVEVGSQISGQVKELYADFNSTVTQGQVIARVAPETYQAKVAQAEAELEIAQAQVLVQRAQIESARAGLENVQAAKAAVEADTTRAAVALEEAGQELERKRPLAGRGFVSAGDWERVQNAYRSAEAQVSGSRAHELSQGAAVRAAAAALRMAEAQLAMNLAQVKQAEAALRQAQIDLEYTYVRAPVTGTVIDRAVSGGQTVAASLQTPKLFTIAQDLRQMQVEASVVEADVSRFAIGQAVTYTVDAYPGRFFAGTVQQIRKAPRIQQNVVTYVVIIAAENPDELLLPGMTANLQVVVAQREDVLRVPNTALRFRPAGQILEEEQAGRWVSAAAAGNSAGEPGVSGRVFVPGRDGQPMLVPLRLGITDGRMTEVLAGDLTEGQTVITGPAPAPGSAPEEPSSFVTFRLR
jgi:HlyD family secretion protein